MVAKFIIILVLCAMQVASQIKEPYPWLNGGSFSGTHMACACSPPGPPAPLSPDPLVRYRWAEGTPRALQVYNITPVAVWTDSETSFVNLHSLIDTPFAAGVVVGFIFSFLVRTR